MQKYRFEYYLNPIHDGGEEKGPPNSFSSVTSANVRINPQNFLTFSFNRFYALVENFKSAPSASPKLLNLNQDYPSKKRGFSGQMLIKLMLQ